MVLNETLPIGARLTGDGRVSFHVWAPARRRVAVVLECGPGAPAEIELRPERGYFSGFAEGAAAGTRYRFRLDGEGLYPDPASRFQPDGPHGASEVIDPSTFEWTDKAWPGVSLEGQVIYEIHIGTFTEEGTWNAAIQQLPELASAGISLLEVMPVADFPGRFGWGYDGVNLFAPTWLYGRPDDMRRFVNEAHAVNMGVILDVVYNHLGPDGNYLREFSPDYFSSRYTNDWGDPINFDGPNSGPVRELFLANTAYWIEEFHLDGFRLDATQSIFDASSDHILAAIVRRGREAARGRKIVTIAEHEPQHTRMVRPPESGGHGIDAIWNDDFHHSSMVAATGHNEAYYTDYLGTPQEFISGAKYGFLYQGQRYSWQKQRRGTWTGGLRRSQFVNFVQNHDQVANSTRGERLHSLTSPGLYRTITALLLLLPATPMLFQGQEFASSKRFYYFGDHQPALAKTIREGRANFLAQFLSMANPETRESLADPGNPATFQACKLDFSDREKNASYYTLHKDLIRLRRTDEVFRAQGAGGLDGAVLSDHAFVIRYSGKSGDDRLLLVNFGRDLRLEVVPEPLLAPPPGAAWTMVWSSEELRYGGSGGYPPEVDGEWQLPGQSAIVMRPEWRQDGADV